MTATFDVETSTAEFVKAQTVADDLGVHYLTVLRWVRDGELPAVRFPGRRIGIPMESYREFRRSYRPNIV